MSERIRQLDHDYYPPYPDINGEPSLLHDFQGCPIPPQREFNQTEGQSDGQDIPIPDWKRKLESYYSMSKEEREIQDQEAASKYDTGPGGP